jgi:Flp pilus assembly protein TadB
MPTPSFTHPELAWIAKSFPIWIGLGAMLISIPLLRRAISAMLARLQHPQANIPAALRFVPPLIDPTTLAWIGIGTGLVAASLPFLLGAWLHALIIFPTVSICTALITILVAHQRYRQRLDRALPAAVGQLSLRLQSGESFLRALEQTLAELNPGPLKVEWSFLRTTLERPQHSPAESVAALAEQTASRRHATLLLHLAVALSQTQDALTRRVAAAHTALLAAERRRSAAATELAQIRYSGFLIGGIALFMALYLGLTQTERFMAAYSGPLAPLAIPLVGIALLLPFVGGVLLTQIQDQLY